MSYADYGNKYGTVPDQLSKYIINEKTIIGVVDENAKTQPQANSARTSEGEEESEGAGFDFYVPENLVPDAEGNFTFTVTLDPTESSLYYRNEVRTLAGADQNPKFYAASVTIKIAPDWTPISVTTVENYDVAIPVLGAMNCTSNMLEVFYDVDIDDGVIPEREFFQPYVDNAKNDPSYVPPDIPEGNRSPADYLATAFADYISGERNLDLTVDINAAGIWAYDLILSLNIGTMDVRAMLGDLYVKYSGDKVNIKLNDINGYLNTADFASLIQNEQISALLSGLGGLSDFDIMSLFGGDMLGTVFSNCEMTTENGITRIHMPFALDISALGLGADAVDIDASIYIAEEDMSLRSITGEITLFGKKITIEAKPLTRLPSFPSTEGAVDLSGLLDFVPDILTLAQSKTFGISGTVTALGQTLGVSAYVDITDGIKADAVISAMGADVSVKYVDGTIYLGVGAIDARGTASELMDLAAPLLGSVDINKYLDIIKLMLPSTVNDFVGMIKSLEVTPEKLTLGVNILTSPITLSLERAGGSITGLEFAFNFDMFGIKLDAAADLDITTPEARKIQLPSGEDYITFAQLAKLIEQVKPYLDAKAFDVVASGSVTASSKFDFTMGAKINLDETGVAASGSVTALGQALNIAYSGTTAYISLGNLKFKLDTNNIDAIADPIMNLLGIELPTVNIDELIPQALSAVKSLTVNDDGKVTAVLQMQDVDITAVIDLAAGTADIRGTAMGVALSLEATVTPLGEQTNVVLPDNTDEYIDLVKFVPTMKSVFGILETKSVSANMAFAMGDIAESALLELSFADGLKARITHAGFGLNITVIGETAYIALGDIRVVGSLNDVPALLDAIDPVLPDNVKQTIADVMGMLGNLPPVQDIIDIALAAVTSLTVDSTDALHATITYNDIAILLSASTDLSTVTANIAAGNNRIVVTLDGISSEEVTVSVPAGSYATLANLTDIAKTIIPLTTEKAFGIALNNVTVLGTTLSGQVYIGTEGGIAVDANLMLADVAVRITVVGGKLYLSVGDSIRLTEQLTIEALQTLAAELEVYIPGITDMLGSLVGSVDISIPTVIQTVLDDVALYAHGENGITIDITVPDAASVAITLDTANGVLSTLSVTGSVLGEAIDVTMSVITNNGVLSGFACDNATVAGIAASLDIGISGAVARNVQPIVDCISVNKLLSSVSQIAEVALAAANGNGVSLGFGTTAIQLGNTSITVSGSAQVSVTPLAAEATLTIALGGDEYALDVVYANGIIYVSHNDIKLQIDAANDVMPLYELIKNMLPAAVTDIVEVMLGNKQGETPFDGIMGIADSINGIVAQPTAQNILSTLLSYDEDNISLAKRLLGMIELSAFGNTSVTLGVTADDMHLDVTPYGNNATVRVDAMGIATSITLSDIVSETVTVSAPAGSYASLGAIVAAATPIMPLIDAAETGTAFELAINCAILSSPISSEGEKVQTPITGTVYIDLTNGLVLEARLTVGDLPIVMIIVDGNLYLSVNNNIKISETLTLESIKALVAQLDKVLPGIEKIVTELIDSIINMTLHDLLGIIVLNQGADAGSFSVAIDLTDRVDIAAQIDISTDGSALDNISINGALFGTEVSFALGYTGTTDDGTLNLGGKDITITSDKTDEATGKTEKTATVLELVLGIGVKRTEARTAPVKPIKDCIAISKLMDYLDPVLALVDDINKGVDTITLDLGAIALFTEDNSQINISGKVKVELSRGIKVRAELSLFDGTENAVALNITYVDSTVYVQLEKFLISLNTESDFQRLYDVIQNYLPTYINIEIAKLFGLKDVLEGLGAANSASAFSNLSLLIERLGDIATAESVDQAITLLFTSLNSLYSDSAIKSMLNLIVGLGLNEAEELTVSAEVMGITLNVTPHVSPATAEKTATISSATVSVNLTDGITIKLMANGYKLSVAPDGQFVSDIFAPNDANKYLSVMDFVELINDAINTFTTFDPN
ncbi:MAG: hypothetical protein J1G04_06370, partial [Clostridiales bacterium]|nr:hypothetical protein [Clostridiales bacterium]